MCDDKQSVVIPEDYKLYTAPPPPSAHILLTLTSCNQLGGSHRNQFCLFTFYGKYLFLKTYLWHRYFCFWFINIMIIHFKFDISVGIIIYTIRLYWNNCSVRLRVRKLVISSNVMRCSVPSPSLGAGLCKFTPSSAAS